MSDPLCRGNGQGGTGAGTGAEAAGRGGSEGDGQGGAGQGPFVVALGGGHGLAVTLAAVSSYAGRVTAVVSVADDGGSSGRLKQWWHGPAPGDVRRCLLALAGPGVDEQAWAKALDYRFGAGELDGHSLGNLVLVALSETAGGFEHAVAQVAQLLGARADVLPATSGPIVLWAEMDTPQGPERLQGQARITHASGRLRRVWLDPPSPPVPDEVLEAIATADQVVIGPGSLFTSVLAACAVPAIRHALRARRGGRVYVCNLDHQNGETAGFDAAAHVAALLDHDVVVDTVVCDPAAPVGALSWGADGGAEVAPGGAAGEDGRRGPGRPGPGQVVMATLAAANGHSHDPGRLAEVLKAAAGVGTALQRGV